MKLIEDEIVELWADQGEWQSSRAPPAKLLQFKTRQTVSNIIEPTGDVSGVDYEVACD